MFPAACYPHPQAARGAAAYTPPLDAVTSKVLLSMGLRRLFTGNAESLEVRRSSDNTAQAIDTLATGYFDDAGFNTWVGGSSGFARTAYDQKGSADFVQTTAGSQPGVSLTGMNSLACLTFASGNLLVTGNIANTIGTGDFEAWFLFQPTTLTGNRALGALGNYSPSFYCSTTGGAAKLAFFDGAAVRVFNTTLVSGTPYLVRFFRVSGTMYCAVNGTTEASSYSHSLNIANPSQAALGSEITGASGAPYVGSMGVCLWLHSGLTSQEAATLTTQLKAFGGIA